MTTLEISQMHRYIATVRIIEPIEAARLRQGPLPAHVAIVMDGNGRWASYQGLERTDGHYAAQQPVLDCIDVALELEIHWLSFYVFSTENWTRPSHEVAVLLDFAHWFFSRETLDSLKSRGVRIHIIGDRTDHRIPEQVRERFITLEQDTIENDALELVVAFNYGGQAEIVRAVQRAIEAGVDSNSLDVNRLQEFMFLPRMPTVDLFIRTSGEQRLSNFFLWHMAYAELVFCDTLWPDFGRGHLRSAVFEFQIRYRRYGSLPWSEQG